MSDSGFKNFKISDRKTYIVLEICMICLIKNQLISIFSEETTITIKETKNPVGEHFKISGHKWKDVTVVFLAIIVTG